VRKCDLRPGNGFRFVIVALKFQTPVLKDVNSETSSC